MKRQPKLFIFSIVFVIWCLQSCPTAPDSIPEPGTVSIVYTNAAEVWLRVQAPDSTAAGLRVYRGEHLVADYATPPADTVVIDTGLTPRTTYIYSTMRVQSGAETAASEPVPVTTLPTTSHHFTWTVDTLGTAGSYLRDVAIVDEDDIWAVGNIETDSGRYNLAKWNGQRWLIEQIGPVGNNLYGILAFTPNDVWVTNFCSPYHWDGREWTYFRFSSAGVGVDACAGSGIWGPNPMDIYFAGDKGNIVHYDGNTFKQMASETTDWIIDLFGTGPTDVWAVTYAEYPHSNTVRHWNGKLDRTVAVQIWDFPPVRTDTTGGTLDQRIRDRRCNFSWLCVGIHLGARGADGSAHDVQRSRLASPAGG